MRLCPVWRPTTQNPSMSALASLENIHGRCGTVAVAHPDSKGPFCSVKNTALSVCREGDGPSCRGQIRSLQNGPTVASERIEMVGSTDLAPNDPPSWSLFRCYTGPHVSKGCVFGFAAGGDDWRAKSAFRDLYGYGSGPEPGRVLRQDDRFLRMERCCLASSMRRRDLENIRRWCCLALMASNVTLKMFADADLLAAGIQLTTQ
jgi:hypothetical protein